MHDWTLALLLYKVFPRGSLQYFTDPISTETSQLGLQLDLHINMLEVEQKQTRNLARFDLILSDSLTFKLRTGPATVISPRASCLVAVGCRPHPGMGSTGFYLGLGRGAGRGNRAAMKCRYERGTQDDNEMIPKEWQKDFFIVSYSILTYY